MNDIPTALRNLARQEQFLEVVDRDEATARFQQHLKDQYDVDAVRFQGVPDPLRSSFGGDHIGDHSTIALDQAADHWSVAVDLRIFWAHHDPHPRTLNDIDAYQACADQHADVRRGQLRAGRHQQRARSRHGTLRFNIFPGRDRLYALHEIGRLWFSQPQRDHRICARGDSVACRNGPQGQQKEIVRGRSDRGAGCYRETIESRTIRQRNRLHRANPVGQYPGASGEQ